MAARRPEQGQEYLRTPQSSQPPALTHHHSMSTPINGGVQPSPHSIAPHPTSGRPGLDRAHTFPTPPASASSLTMGFGNAGSSYEYGTSAGAMHTGQHLSIDTTVHARNMPTTPATTPPGSNQGMPYQTSQASYDSQRQMYSAPPAYAPQPQYGPPSTMHRYNHVQASPGGVKTEMGPPTRGGTENDHPDAKHHDGYSGQQDADAEHEGEYTHNSASIGASPASYSYKPNSTSGPAHSDPSHISPDMTHSPHQAGSGRATPRTAPGYTGYNNAPQRPTQLPTTNLTFVMSNDNRAAAPNGNEYGAQPSYPPVAQYPAINGGPVSNKRGRDADDQEDPYGRPISASGDGGLKRQRTDPGAISARPISQPQSLKAGGARR